MKSRTRRKTAPPPPLIAGLLRPGSYPHAVRALRMLETHISWVLLTGDVAYKIKKPVDLGFLDFSTLEARRHYCAEELRLNRRLAPALYLDVAAICGTEREPRIGGGGEPIEYAVRMRQFPQRALASSMLARGALTGEHVDELARLVARFHAGAAVASGPGPHGTPGAVLAPALDNFGTLFRDLARAPDRAALQALRRWTRASHAALEPVLAARRDRGFVRECHGDLHLRNVVVLEGRPVAFDCIEFNDALRWIDVMSEAAFTHMDLEDRGRPDLARRFLNRYLEATGDYEGLAVLRFYSVYRALVRAKVHAMRARQEHVERRERARLLRAARGYVRLAGRFAAPERPALIITHGLSGSGKTTATESLIAHLPAVRVRSDLERKRLHGLAPLERSGSGLDSGIYAPQATVATYERLAQLARTLIAAGYTAVVDAAFLKRAERADFRALARRAGVPFLMLDFRAPEAVLRGRVARRLRHGADASEADLRVLERQLATHEPLAAEEARSAVIIDTRRPINARTWHKVRSRLRRTR